jgi:hypothetical protein
MSIISYEDTNEKFSIMSNEVKWPLYVEIFIIYQINYKITRVTNI